MKPVRSMTRSQLRSELFSLNKQFAETRTARGGSPAEWMDERADEIRTELRRRRPSRQQGK